jgi:membrane-bound lytic murein transglycosylase D
MKKSVKCLCTLLAVLVLQGCSGAVSSMWVGSNGRDSSRLDEISPESRLLLESALESQLGRGDSVLFTLLPEVPRVNAPEVDHFVTYYTSGPGRRTIAEGIGRREIYAPQMDKILMEYGLPRELVNLPFIESRYLSNARSPRGAVGMWQFMRETARHCGLTVSLFTDERTDVEKATRAAALHLRELYDIFEDWHLAIAAYNGGVGRVQEAVKTAGTRDFFELRRRGFLPRETQDYVPRFLAIGLVLERGDFRGVASNSFARHKDS